MIRVFIGYDSKQPLSFHVLSHSIHRRASVPVSITPVALTQLSGVYTRARGPLESTEFSISRFLVPHLAGFVKFEPVVYMDCDMLCLADIAELVDPLRVACELKERALWCVQHDYTPRDLSEKMLGAVQAFYPRKNWSSLMVMHAAYCAALTPHYVNTARGLDLHRFAWLPDEQIGSLDSAWNHLVGEYAPRADAKLVHFTLGGPWLGDAFQGVEYAAEWRAERDHMLG